MPEFTRTQAAAGADKKSRWELVAAIAQDAVDAGLPITSADSVIAAKAAVDAVGLEMTADTVKNLTCLSKFDHESTDRQRQEWRRYGTSTVQEVAKAGWSQEAAFDLLATPKRRTHAEVRHAISISRDDVIPEPHAPDLNAELHNALGQINAWFLRMAGLADRADTEDVELDGHAAGCIVLYERLTERKFDIELRELLDSETAR
mgnify:CR=1 FL=1